jgi:short-subunit dehydrogenase
MNEPVFQDNVVVITGASSGIGREVAYQLAEQGAWLALAARNATRLAETSNQCLQRGGKTIVVPTDVAVQSQCQALIDATVAAYGRIDTLINNAGIGHAAKFSRLKDFSTYEQVIQVNFWGSIYCTYYALPYLKKSRGRLVGVSSLRGRLPSATADGYGESKHAISGFYDCLRNELAGSGISVTQIFPNWVNTGISGRALRPDGTLTGEISEHEVGAMPAEVCARMIIRAMAKRKRELVMSFEGKLGLWARMLVPSIVDYILRKKT